MRPAGRRAGRPTREVKLIVDYRRDLVAEHTRVDYRLRPHLHELDPIRLRRRRLSDVAFAAPACQ
jgi:hypothetical protein